MHVGIVVLRTYVAVIMITGACALAPRHANAAEVYHSSFVKWVYPLGDGSFVLTFTADSANCSSASSPKYQHVRVNENGVTEEGAKKLYAAAMLAFAMGRPVDVAFDNGTTYCFINRLAVKE